VDATELLTAKQR